MSLCAEYHPYYSRVFREHGLPVERIRTTDDLVLLPLTAKADLMNDPEAFRLRLPGTDPFEAAVWDVVYTTGTTAGRPTPIFNSPQDFYGSVEAYRRMNEIRGIGPDDVVANLLPMSRLPHGAFLRYVYGSMATTGRLLVPLVGPRMDDFPVHRTVQEAIRLVAEERATVLVGVPSFLRRFLREAAELGVSMETVRMLCLVGEPVTQTLRDDLRQHALALGARSVHVSISYGASELQSGFVECAEGAGLHNPVPDLIFVEIVDPDTGQRLPDGQEGAVAITHLHRTGTVLLRYLLGDLAVLSHEPCPVCGRTTERIVAGPRRRDSLVKVKGMLINPEALCRQLMTIPRLDEFRVVVTKEDPEDPHSVDVLLVQAAAAPETRPETKERIVDLTRRATGVTPRVEFVAVETLRQPEDALKAKRFVDERK